MNILIVEDEKKVAKALKDGLEAEGYTTVVAHSGEEGYYLIHEKRFDLVILDIMLPSRNGIAILKAIRSEGIGAPVIVLTAKDAIEDRVLGLDSGADDYLIKPFAFPELLARIRSILRRGRIERLRRLKLADLAMDTVVKKVTRNQKSIPLTAREFDLLEYLMRHSGQVVSREMIAHDIWKEPNRATPLDNVIDVHIARLRRKMDDPFPKKLLHTVRGVGFILRTGDA